MRQIIERRRQRPRRDRRQTEIDTDRERPSPPPPPIPLSGTLPPRNVVNQGLKLATDIEKEAAKREQRPTRRYTD